MFKRGRSPAGLKWVDPGMLAMTVWPQFTAVGRVRYFTALVKPTAADPRVLARQQIYLRALAARGVDVHYGQFKLRSKNWFLDAALAQRPPTTGAAVMACTVKIAKYDEKGSDVNLASYLVRDAALRDCAHAVVVSNDSDLVEAINIARNDFGSACTSSTRTLVPSANCVRSRRTCATCTPRRCRDRSCRRRSPRRTARSSPSRRAGSSVPAATADRAREPGVAGFRGVSVS